ncbi:hypothetical protein ABIE58_000466 [Roseovarius sp. MBR-78]|uniref:hypothetical protein n=1 Tax=Roseovarius sp. MBR-78 TaxID=3156460 RepID=UPI003394404E
MSDVNDIDAELLDVWNSNTFGRSLCEELSENQALIEQYHREDARLLGLDRNEHLAECLRGNRYFNQYEALQIRVADIIAERQIRVWHYTRLLDFEITAMKNAIEVSTEEGMQARLTELERRGHLSAVEVQMLLERSALKTQKECRENRFFCVPSPMSVTERGVELLLRNWGGEVVYFHQQDEDLLQKLQELGLPRVIEIAAKVSDSMSRYSLADCVLNTYAVDLGFPLCPTNTDLCIKENPPPAKVLAVHTQGEQAFHQLGCGYPDGAEVLRSRHGRWNKSFDG